MRGVLNVLVLAACVYAPAWAEKMVFSQTLLPATQQCYLESLGESVNGELRDALSNFDFQLSSTLHRMRRNLLLLLLTLRARDWNNRLANLTSSTILLLLHLEITRFVFKMSKRLQQLSNSQSRAECKRSTILI